MVSETNVFRSVQDGTNLAQNDAEFHRKKPGREQRTDHCVQYWLKRQD